MRVTVSIFACVAVLGGCAESGSGAPAPVTPAPAAPASAAPAVASPPPPPEGLPGEQALVPIAHDVAVALTNIMSPEGMPAAWANRVGSPSQAFKTRWASLTAGGKGEPVATLLDIGAVTLPPGSRAEVQAKFILLGDGRIRWSTVAAREGAAVDANPTPGLPATEPAVSDLLLKLIGRLNSGPCQLPFLTGEELLSLPASLRGELGVDLPTFADSCAIIRKHKDATWGPILEAAVVVLRQGDSYIAVAAHFLADTASGKLVLEPVDVAPVKGSTMELAWASTAAGAPSAKHSGATPAAAPKAH